MTDYALSSTIRGMADALTTFPQRLRAARLRAKLTQPELAKLCGWDSQSRISHYELGRRKPEAAEVERLSKALLTRGVHAPPGWLLYGAEGSMDSDEPFEIAAPGERTGLSLVYPKGSIPPESVGVRQAVTEITPDAVVPLTYSIPRLEIEGAMGLAGRVQPEYETILGTIEVNQQFVRTHMPGISSPKNLRIVTAVGDSMWAAETRTGFQDGDSLWCDVGVTEVRADAVYFFALNDELHIKRLQRRPDNTLVILSDNTKYPPYTVDPKRERVRVIGRIWGAWNFQKL